VNSIRIAYNTSYNVVFSTEDPYRIMMFFPWTTYRTRGRLLPVFGIDGAER
jgi:hypothetical protein